MDAVWGDFVSGAEVGAKGKGRIVFKDDAAFCDLGSVQRGMSSRVDADEPELAVAMRAFQRGEEGGGSGLFYADSHAFHSKVYDDKPSTFTASKKAKVDASKLFLPPAEEIEAVDTYCDALQKQAVAAMVKKSKLSHEKALPNLRERVKKLKIKGTSEAWGEEHLEKMLLWIRDEAPIIIHVPFDADGRLEKLTKDTHFRNQFETKISRGTLDFSASGSRAGWEDRIFEKNYHSAEAFQRPKYGCLNIVNDPRGISAATSYGDSYMILKKCRLRTSFADKDSSCTDAQIASCEYHAHVLNKYSDAELQRVLEVSNRMRLWHKSDVVHTYKEVQIHGEIRLSDNVDLIVLHEKYKGNKGVVAGMEAFCEKNNCKYIFMPSYSDAEGSFKGDLWEMAGKTKPEGFLDKHKTLPEFLTTGDEVEDEVVTKKSPPEHTTALPSSPPTSPTAKNCHVRISVSECVSGKLTGINHATGMYLCLCDGKPHEAKPEDVSFGMSFVKTGLKFCMGDMVHAKKKGAKKYSPGIVHRIERSGLVGVIFEDDDKRKTHRVVPADVVLTAIDVKKILPGSGKTWGVGCRVVVEGYDFQCHPGVVKAVLPHSQLQIVLGSGELGTFGVHRVSDEPDTVLEKETKIGKRKYSPGEVVHARYSHKEAYPGVVVKTGRDGKYLVRFLRNEVLPSPEAVHSDEIRPVGRCVEEVTVDVPELGGEVVGSDMFYFDWMEPEEVDEKEKVKKMVKAAYDESDKSLCGGDLFGSEEEEVIVSEGSDKFIGKFDLFGDDDVEGIEVMEPEESCGLGLVDLFGDECTLTEDAPEDEEDDDAPPFDLFGDDEEEEATKKGAKKKDEKPTPTADYDYDSDEASEISLTEATSIPTPTSITVPPWAIASTIVVPQANPRPRRPAASIDDEKRPTLSELCKKIQTQAEKKDEKGEVSLKEAGEAALRLREKLLMEIMRTAEAELELTRTELREKVRAGIREMTQA